MYDSQPETVSMPSVGEAGEPCRSCGAPLAADQRYCLNCGEGRGNPRVDPAQLAAVAGTTAPPPETAQAVQTAPARTSPPREPSPLAAVGGIAILGLMLLAGVLIGRGGDDETQQPTAVVAAPATTAAADTGADDAAAAEDDATAATDKPQDDGGGGGAGGGGNENGVDGGGLGAGGGEDVEEPVQASTEDLQALEAQSGDDYAEASEDLPDTIATPGEAPPVDNEAPGAGTSATTIK